MITRIRELLDSKELSPTQFADLIGVGRPVVSHILSERNKPSLDVVQRIIGAFPEISLPWLLSGTGNMLDEAVVAAPDPSETNENEAVATLAIESQPATQPASAVPTPPPVAELPLYPPISPVEAPRVAAAKPVVPAQPAASPTNYAVSAPVSAVASGAKPFRVPRFVPGAKVTATAAVAALPPAPPQSELAPSVPPATATVAPAATTAKVAPAASLPPASSSAETVGLPFLLEPGKAIRRIVIFYRDGSFADYQPE